MNRIALKISNESVTEIYTNLPDFIAVELFGEEDYPNLKREVEAGALSKLYPMQDAIAAQERQICEISKDLVAYLELLKKDPHCYRIFSIGYANMLMEFQEFLAHLSVTDKASAKKVSDLLQPVMDQASARIKQMEEFLFLSQEDTTEQKGDHTK